MSNGIESRQFAFKGNICYSGFSTVADIEEWMAAKRPVDIEFFLCLPAGLHPDAAIVIRKKETT